jgi:small subunit ribosomal protein S2
MPAATMRELLEAGVHFGHQTRRWNPKMRRYIFTERNGIYIIDLQKTLRLADNAYDFVREQAARGGQVLFVGTKKQARDAVREHAARAGQPYVNHRWLGGLLTNFRTIADRISYLHELRRLRAEGQLDLLPTKERLTKLGELEKLEINLGGVADMRRLPQAVFVIDLKAEALAVREARRLNIPLIGLVDTNCDPDEVDLVIPGNDDAIRACDLMARVIADAVAEGRGIGTGAEAAEDAEAAEGEEPAADAGEGEPDVEPVGALATGEPDVEPAS